jgi:hypothetical protein
MTALRAAEQPRVLNRSQHLVDPRPGGVHDEACTRAAGASRGLPIDACDAPCVDPDTSDLRVRLHDRAVSDGVAHVLDHEPFGKPHLRVVVAGAAN